MWVSEVLLLGVVLLLVRPGITCGRVSGGTRMWAPRAGSSRGSGYWIVVVVGLVGLRGGDLGVGGLGLEAA